MSNAEAAAARRERRVRALERAEGVWTAGNRYVAVLVLLIGLVVYFSFTQTHFFTHANIENLLTSVSILWVVSMGMTFVVITAGIDLSVGSLLALSGIVLGKLFNNAGVPMWLAIIVTVIIAGIVGAGVNGVLIGRVGLSFFVVTLGTLSIYEGIVNIWSKTQTTYVSSPLLGGIGFGHGLGIATPIWIMIGVYLVAFVVLRWTYLGRDIYAVGGNIEAARLSGINVSRTLMSAYGIVGLCAGLAGVIQAGRLGAASPQVGADIPLNSAAAVLLGGTSFVGGVGGVTGTAVGVLFIGTLQNGLSIAGISSPFGSVLFIGTLQNGLSIAGISSFWQEIVTGAILIAAVSFDKLQQNRGGRLFRPPGARTAALSPEAGPASES